MRNDPLLLNKIVGAILIASLLGMVSGLIPDQIYQNDVLETQAYAIGGSDRNVLVKKQVAKPESIVELLASANTIHGEKLFRACVGCHTVRNGGINKVGPNLWDVIGSPLAGKKGYRYSSALRKMDGRWDYESLNSFLFKPKAFAPGTKMTYAGMKVVKNRADIIAYIRSLSANPEPLP